MKAWNSKFRAFFAFFSKNLGPFLKTTAFLSNFQCLHPFSDHLTLFIVVFEVIVHLLHSIYFMS